ncbi:MAG: hypothetical protein A2527_03255 [Candidatus Lambdaproteobacteria bacterium RIFOXYD2_FULL_50_16]|uniref:DUF481 domain-containing protein n=1 Tax=Candidatus Lambdaproteobacteria bacterium RIFOXYD2_FULL_50_16 TaxID=1817772 RepID=A0A1F6GEQ8_9PROT|nr:MAG: hypothetical protein A2527_03255 [Candidatus Lambdaproteobacteria bacterium RIFOXYD2_FULL_50_16]
MKKTSLLLIGFMFIFPPLWAQETPAPASLNTELPTTKPASPALQEPGSTTPTIEPVPLTPPPETTPPQILSPDLLKKQVMMSEDWPVSFVILDDDLIVEVSLNGETLPITPASTIVIKQNLHFKTGRNLYTLRAVDQAGNVSTRSFLVGYNLEEQASDEGGDDQKGWALGAVLGFYLETDDNPTLDLSSPIDVGGLSVQGVVEDSQQADQRQRFQLALSASKPNYNLFLGAAKTDYSKVDNQILGSQVMFLGGGAGIKRGDRSAWNLDLLLTDINLGGFDYAQTIGFKPNIEFSGKEGVERYRHQWGLEFATKSFASTSLTSGNQTGLFWDYRSWDPLDRYNFKFTYGQDTEGSLTSDHSYLTTQFDWANRWDAGLLFNIGFGIQYLNYKNEEPLTTQTPLGATRVDLPLLFNTALGWKLSKWTFKGTYDYRANLSNKVIYVRTLTGLAVNASF